eukprot:TRINITY_DN879_c0_g3_i2.p1 TRINITY_DN879_c0_g3~~TRINITY_DN879_c0_g3_i2.p1  ORF type:complete len:553 (+),score=122.20 TRINITY_DN879_c0_g3_i2:376-2034(+)
MNYILACYRQPMLNQGVIDIADSDLLFRQIENLIEMHEMYFYEPITTRIKNRGDQNIVDLNLSDILYSWVNYFEETYSRYFGNYVISKGLVEEYEKNDPLFIQYEHGMRRTVNYKHDLIDWIKVPITRAMAHVHFIQQLFRYTVADHLQYKSLKETMKKIELAYQNIKFEKKQLKQQIQENEIMLQNIENMFETKLGIVQYSRELLYEGNIKAKYSKINNLGKKSRVRVIFLFNDLLLLAKPNSNKLVLKNGIEIKDLNLVKLDDQVIQNAFQVCDRKENINIILEFPNKLEQKKWLETIKKLIDEYKVRTYQKRNNRMQYLAPITNLTTTTTKKLRRRSESTIHITPRFKNPIAGITKDEQVLPYLTESYPPPPGDNVGPPPPGDNIGLPPSYEEGYLLNRYENIGASPPPPGDNVGPPPPDDYPPPGDNIGPPPPSDIVLLPYDADGIVLVPDDEFVLPLVDDSELMLDDPQVYISGSAVDVMVESVRVVPPSQINSKFISNDVHALTEEFEAPPLIDDVSNNETAAKTTNRTATSIRNRKLPPIPTKTP